ncbi:hypothetical protein HYPSUDRAFT_57018 [Hypholoma sublateritium FD-334 SS-4]|uniref:Uncharacterized protein n=1 Tax=Hypholoma sublateritium (strain FD-334 SS-4) TaxID=945553 RepID=A0A0D2NPM7_HYPSF|nr:hypothetical protein HYPSUDRAFT_57018 [Hypholoma sublateritium FD-334 SS-4]
MGLQRPAILLAFLALRLPQVCATPIEMASLKRRDGNNSSSSVNPKIYVPIAIFLIISFVLVILSKKTNLRRALSGFALTGAAPSAGLGRPTPTGAPRVVTAEQLAGTINGEGAGTTAPTTTRRARRPRRTPSQMSVTSLPAYNKEPGDEELVIFRGEDMEDATMPAAVVRQSADESSLSLDHSQDHSQVSRYSPMPTSPHDMPLLNPDDTFEGDLSMQSLQLPPTEARNPDNNGFHETSSLMRTDTNESADDPRGEAPPYFEVIDRGVSQDTDRTHASPSTSPEPAPSRTANRRSGFRSLFNRMSIATQPNGNTRNDTHTRNDSSNSALSSAPGRESTSRASHRHNPSGSGSVLSASMFRTLSRQRSTHTLASARITSPSMISLNSISSPLTHTVTRTEFTYPKTGPTAEQLKVISSRDAFSRFGVPYGADAIAFASSSRLDLLQPPPDFDTAASTSQLHLVTPASTSSVAADADEPSASSSNPQASSALAPSPPPDSDTAPGSSTAPASSAEPSSVSKKHESISTRSVRAATASSQIPLASDRRSVSEFGNLAPGPEGNDRFESAASVRSTQTYATAAETLAASVRSRQPSEAGDVDGAPESGRATPVTGPQGAEAPAARPYEPAGGAS